ncbi:MAG TPA: COX15/CtaA family protein [Acidobacteriaceae bacterium]
MGGVDANIQILSFRPEQDGLIVLRSGETRSLGPGVSPMTTALPASPPYNLFMGSNSPIRTVREGRGLPTFAAATVAVMVLVILWGAVVRATGSGAGCGANWPLCNGGLLPHHPRIQTLIEFTHRATTGACSVLALVVLGWTFLARRRGDRARTAAVWSVLLLLVEAFLGRALVLHGWVDQNTSDARTIMQSIHFTNTLLLLAAFTLTWWWLRGATSHPASTRARSLAWVALGLTIITGATGSVAALADTLFPSPSLRIGFAQDFAAGAPLLVHMRWLHPAAAVLAVIAAAALCFYLRATAARWIACLLLLQIALGLADLFALAPISLQILHLLGADLFWIALVAACSGVLARNRAPRPIEARP